MFKAFIKREDDKSSQKHKECYRKATVKHSSGPIHKISAEEKNRLGNLGSGLDRLSK